MVLDISHPNIPAQPFGPGVRFSPLVLADHLLTLAREADRAGYHNSASRLIGLMYTILDASADDR